MPCTSQKARQNQTLLAGRKILQSRSVAIKMDLRELLCGHPLKVGPTPPKTSRARVHKLRASIPGLTETINAAHRAPLV